MAISLVGVQRIDATQGNFAKAASQVFGIQFEEIDYSSPRDAYVPGKGVDIAASKHLEREAQKTERNVEKCKSLLDKIDIYALWGLNRSQESKVFEFGEYLVRGGLRFFIIGGWVSGKGVTPDEFIFAVPGGTRSADPLWQEAVRVSGLSGLLVRGIWKTGGQSVSGTTADQGARIIADLLGLVHPAWRLGRDWLVTRDDPLYSKWISFEPVSTGYVSPWGFVYNRLISCGTPPGFQRRPGCDENDMTVSVAKHLMARTRTVYFVGGGGQTPGGGVPVPQQCPAGTVGIWPNCVPDRTDGGRTEGGWNGSGRTGGGKQSQPFSFTKEQVLLFGGIALLLLLGIILISR